MCRAVVSQEKWRRRLLADWEMRPGAPAAVCCGGRLFLRSELLPALRHLPTVKNALSLLFDFVAASRPGSGLFPGDAVPTAERFAWPAGDECEAAGGRWVAYHLDAARGGGEATHHYPWAWRRTRFKVEAGASGGDLAGDPKNHE
eukprot:gene149-324_t